MIEITELLTGKVLLRVPRARLTNADLHGAELPNADLCYKSLAGANLSNANLAEAALVSANLARVNLRGAQLERAQLHHSNFAGAVLAQANLRNADLLLASLPKADLTAAVLTGVMLAGADLADATLVGADLTGANLQKAKLAGANLQGATLTGAVLKQAAFDERTRWPAGFEPEQHGAIRLQEAPPQTLLPEYPIRLVAGPSRPGAASSPLRAGGSKLGGAPGWIQNDETPRCPGCDRAMDFVGQIDSVGCVKQGRRAPDLSHYVFGDCGMVYLFFCPECSEVKAALQSH